MPCIACGDGAGYCEFCSSRDSGGIDVLPDNENCTDCINSIDCVDCVDCVDCFDCDSCVDCKDCSGLSRQIGLYGIHLIGGILQ